MKIYEVDLKTELGTFLIWIKTDGKVIIPKDSCLSDLNEIKVSEDDPGIDLIIEENLS